jgi:hypothetical protein
MPKPYRHPAEAWWQDFNDLVANEDVRLVITARWDDWDASLYLEVRPASGKWFAVADAIGAASLDEAMTELLAKYGETVRLAQERAP